MAYHTHGQHGLLHFKMQTTGLENQLQHLEMMPSKGYGWGTDNICYLHTLKDEKLGSLGGSIS